MAVSCRPGTIQQQICVKIRFCWIDLEKFDNSMVFQIELKTECPDSDGFVQSAVIRAHADV